MYSILSISTLLLLVTTSIAVANSTDTGKISIKGKILSPLSISSAPWLPSRAAGVNRSDKMYTSVSSQPVFFDCDAEAKSCERIRIKGVANNYYSLSFFKEAVSGVSCKSYEGFAVLGGVLNDDGRGSHTCTYEKTNLPAADMTIVLTYD